MGKAKVYVESSTISYLTARPSGNAVVRARQALTLLWWKNRDRYELFVSRFVIDEIANGDAEAAEKRLAIGQTLHFLPADERVKPLAFALLATQSIPATAEFDAYHIASAAVYEMDFLVTWNQKHIAADKKRRQIEAVVDEFGYKMPRLLTPEKHLYFKEANDERL